MIREYCLRLVTDTDGQKWFGKPGIQLKVSSNPLHSFISVNNFISWSWLDRRIFSSSSGKGTTAGAGETNSQSDL